MEALFLEANGIYNHENIFRFVYMLRCSVIWWTNLQVAASVLEKFNKHIMAFISTDKSSVIIWLEALLTIEATFF